MNIYYKDSFFWRFGREKLEVWRKKLQVWRFEKNF